MTIRYTVFRGPGNRLVAISAEPHGEKWIVRSGEEGKRLRHADADVKKYHDFGAVRDAFVSDDYQCLFTGVIDTYGRSAEPSASLIYWEATSIEVGGLADRLRQFAQLAAGKIDGLQFVDDMTGCTVRLGRSIFGVTRAVTPGCISFDGNGSDAVSTDTSADLTCLVASLAGDFSIRLADASGNALTSGQVMSRCSSAISEGMADYLRASGHASLSLTLRALPSKRTQIRF